MVNDVKGNVVVPQDDLTKDDMYDFLKDEDSGDEEEKPKKETKEEPEEEIEEIELKDEENKEDEKEEDEEVEIHTPVSRKKILKEYPDLFKKFPFLENAMYRNYQFTEIFPTIDDAKDASEKAEMLDGFRKDLLDGNIESALGSIRKADEEAFKRLVDNYLPQLAHVDKDAYFHIIGNVVKTLVVNMVKEGRAGQNENLEKAANLVNQFMFGTSELSMPSTLSKSSEVSDEKSKLQKERDEFTRQRYETVASELDNKVENALKSTIGDYIDPKSSMSEYVKRNAIRDAYDILEQSIREDKSFASSMNRLWEKAFQENFSKSSLDRIRSAYLAKAKTLLPTAIKKARMEALKERPNPKSDEKDKRGPITPGRSTSPNSGKTTHAKDIPKHMSSYDFLNQD